MTRSLFPKGDRGNWTTLLSGVLFLAYFALSLRQLVDYDVWFQLLAGKYAFENLAVPRMEFYIYSGLGESTTFVGWLWGAILYVAWQIYGYAGISLLNAIVWGLVFAVGAKAAVAITSQDRHREDGPVSKELLIAAVFIASATAYQYLATRAIARAEVTLFLTWVIAMYFLAGTGSRKARIHRFLIAVPMLSFVLGWLHSTAIFLAMLLTCAMAQSLFDAIRNTGKTGLMAFLKTDLWKWLLSLLLAIVLPVLNPNGMASALALYTSSSDAVLSLFSERQAAGEIVRVNLEYRPLLDVPSRWPTAALFLLASVFAIWHDRPRRIMNTLLLAGGMLMALMHVRGLAVWAIFLLVPLSVSIASALEKYPVAAATVRERSVVITIATACFFWSAGAVYNKVRTAWGLGYTPSPATVAMLDSIRKSMPTGGNIFNWHAAGSFLRWHLGENYYVAMDGHLLDDKSLMSSAYYDIADFGEQAPAMIDKWEIRAVYFHSVNPLTGQINALPYYLANNSKWHLAGTDENGVLFIRSQYDIDDRRRLSANLDYWKSVAVNAKFVELKSSNSAHRLEAQRSFDIAGRRLEELRRTIGR